MKKLHLHFMGIAGPGMSAAAQMVFQAGESINGCDHHPSATVCELEKVGINVQIGHSVDHLTDVDMLVITPAIPAIDPHNPELEEAQRRNIPIVTWQELVGNLIKDKCVLSVSGVHGKSTTTSILSLMLVDAGLDPTCLIGAVVPRLGANYRLGQGTFVVNEADEYNHNFWHYHPRLAIVKAIELDHPEFFADYSAFLSAFEHFVRGMDSSEKWPFPPTLLLNIANPGCRDLRERLTDWTGRIITYSLENAMPVGERADFEAYDIRLDGETSFCVRTRMKGKFPVERRIALQLPGLYNVENALSALVAASLIGVEADTLIRTLGDFIGTRRRFEIRHNGPLPVEGTTLDVILVDDYAHHPTAIRAILEAARQRYPERRLVAVYQPHMYSRTKTFFEQFVQAFDVADLVVFADIFPGRERDSGLVSTRDLVTAVAQRSHFGSGQAEVLYGGSVTDTALVLKRILRTGDLAVIMGAGDIYKVTEQLVQEHV